MLREFAVEPELFGQWSEFRYLHEKFGVPKARMIAEFPKKWRRMVYEAATDFTEIQRKTLEDWMANKDSFLVPSGRKYTLPDNWQQSAEAAHAQNPFHAILANGNPRAHQQVLLPRDMPIENHPLFKCPYECFMPRDISGFMEISGFLLKCSKQIIFVDPYFKASSTWGESLQAMLSCVPPEAHLLRYCTGVAPRGEEEAYRITDLKEKLPKFISQGKSVEVVLLNKDAGMDMHNRYILTERGGIKFPWGLDTSGDGSSDIVNLMEEYTSESMFREYSSLVGRSVYTQFTVVGVVGVS